MDYGCGRGGDVARLIESGFDCTGWDPVHAPAGLRRRAEVVNIGYVVNVIENPVERRDALRQAWALTEGVLVVSARLQGDTPLRPTGRLEDGVLTRTGTFQKFFEQQELKNWIDQSLEVQSAAAAPGIFYVFRRSDARESFLAQRFRRRTFTPRLRLSDKLVAEHRNLLDGLATFLAKHGRLPVEDEFDAFGKLLDTFGSLLRAYRLLQSISDPAVWDLVRRSRTEDILVYLALSRFDGRPRFGVLPLSLQRDVKAFFGPYATACREADALLFSLGRLEHLTRVTATSPIGKLLPTALYLHVDAMAEAPLLLRLYEGCARAIVGQVEGANVLKLRRDEPKVSYLSYPDFSTDPHPALAASLSVHLQTFRLKTRRYEGSENPPILHRKEAFLSHDHPDYSKYARLSRIEESKGLYQETSLIGTRAGWAEALRRAGLKLHGHRLVRA